MRLLNLNDPGYTGCIHHFMNDLEKINPAGSGRGLQYLGDRPAVNITEAKETIFMDIVVPGFSKDEIRLSVEKNHLRVEGKIGEQKDRATQLLHHEFEKRDFVRTFELSGKIDFERIDARLENGILHLEIAKKQLSEQTRKIEIS